MFSSTMICPNFTILSQTVPRMARMLNLCGDGRAGQVQAVVGHGSPVLGRWYQCLPDPLLTARRSEGPLDRTALALSWLILESHFCLKTACSFLRHAEEPSTWIHCSKVGFCPAFLKEISSTNVFCMNLKAEPYLW